MRLGQLARKYEIQVQEIIDYLEEQTGEKFHPNAKIYDTLEAKVFDHFQLIPEESAEEEELVEEVEIQEEKIEEKIEVELVSEQEIKLKDENESSEAPITPEEEIAAADGEVFDSSILENKPTPGTEQSEIDSPSEEEVIQTDKLLELLESEDSHSDLDKIKLIKAPKKELAGLKVVGKVDLPEPKKKEEKPKEIVTEKDLREYRYPNRKKRQPLTEEEKEKRRLKAKKKKEAFEARQEKRKQEQEDRNKKARKQEHYKQKLEAKTTQVKRKNKQQTFNTPKPKEDSKPQPKTILGRFWRWLNT